jgi:hypothetical protein
MSEAKTDFLHQKNRWKEVKVECQIKKCSKQPVQNVEKNVKFRSNPIQAGQSTVVNAGQRKDQPDHQEDIKLTA